MADIEQIRSRFHDRLDSYSYRTYWRENHAGQDMAVLLRHIDNLESELAGLRKQKTPRAEVPDKAEPRTSCQCHTTPRPPCSWCTSGDNPANAEEVTA